MRCYSGVALLVLDEATLIPDELYFSLRPMLAVSRGKMFAAGTPRGQRGWFYRDWLRVADAAKFMVTAASCPRISPELLASERAAMGDSWVAQEYLCSFLNTGGAVFPTASAWIGKCPFPVSVKEAGVDFGFRNPCALVLAGYLDGVCYVVEEHYSAGTGIDGASHLFGANPNCVFFCDPASPELIKLLQKRGVVARKAKNAILPSIEVLTRLENAGCLKIHPCCRNLIAELGTYRYGKADGEGPVDEYNHAISALRYLVMTSPYCRELLSRFTVVEPVKRA